MGDQSLITHTCEPITSAIIVGVYADKS